MTTSTIRVLIALLLLAACAAASLADAPPEPPGAKERCPVCGMRVSGFPDWLGSIVFEDGETAYFDGPKDLFKCLFDLERFLPPRTRKTVSAVWVTGYYGVEPLCAKDAWFVVGSDVHGPMGHELVPLASKDEAEEFLKDHAGERILRLADVTPRVIAGLDAR